MAVGSKVSNSPKDPKIVDVGTVPRITHGPVEAASQSYNAGALLTISGLDVTAATAGQVLGDVVLGGFAVKDATGTTGADAPIWAPEVGQEWYMEAGTAGTGVTVTTTLFPLFDNFDLYIDSNGYCTVDSATETHPKVKVVGYVKDVNGDYTTKLRVIPYVGNETDDCHWAAIQATIS